jgi:hypothetical protein
MRRRNRPLSYTSRLFSCYQQCNRRPTDEFSLTWEEGYSLLSVLDNVNPPLGLAIPSGEQIVNHFTSPLVG